MPEELTETTQTVQQLNDILRTTMLSQLGMVILTPGLKDHPLREEAITAVRGFSDFTEDNDPYGEHDFGVIEIDQEKFYWKIDYYDKELKYGSEDPADPSVTTRVLTIMLAEEY